MFSVDTTNRADYYAYLARLNFECADHADRKIGFLPGYELAAPPPVMTLCAHAIELSLKSLLLKNGNNEDEVRKLGHDLVKLWDTCKANNANLPQIDENILAIISDLLTSHRLRYGEQPKLGRVPVYGPLSELVRQCLDLCGAPQLADLVN
ncbi:hypothetical protein [Yoonia sp. 67]|uniref:hypothetical protein n=1 Tax=Yoonia sp. 67 TaxID=3081449 RepID=UPI002B002353|nr:hypothetical protein [Yoonia sp. 67]